MTAIVALLVVCLSLPSQYQCGRSVLNCNFETADLCGYTQDSSDDGDWVRLSGPTAGVNTGPDFDHTLGNGGGGFYMHMIGNTFSTNELTRLISPSYTTGPTAECLQFYYHMYGQHINEMNVYSLPDGDSPPPTNVVWTLSGEQGNMWLLAQVDLPATSTFRLYFEAVRGSGSKTDMAIDDIILRPAACGDVTSPCDPNPCENGGQCTVEVDTFSCQCLAGWMGIYCETVEDPCLTNPCQNGGTCSPDVADISQPVCECVVGFIGDTCNIADPCLTNPCQNGGTCSPDVADISQPVCECVVGFIGDTCNIADPCLTNPCQNGGTCSPDVADISQPVCECVVGFIGDTCNIADPCLTNPCQNGGTCSPDVADISQPVCECVVGFIGDTCNIADPCLTNPCQNGGTCSPDVADISQPVCECVVGFIGDTCNIADPCLTNPCQNGGTCSPDVADISQPVCECVVGFIGDTCNIADPCLTNPCQNGGTCSPDFPDISQPVCECVVGFIGVTCNIAAPCDVSPCQNGGFCGPDPADSSQYICSCAAGFIGDNCNTADPCSNSPCANGDCYPNPADLSLPFCLCDPGYIGDMCDISDPCTPNPCVDGGLCYPHRGDLTQPICFSASEECNPNPCQNGGICSAQPTCECPLGYFGALCNDLEDQCCSGYELVSGSCRPCARGSYKNNDDGDGNCISCPPGYTTRREAATNVRSCSLIPCTERLDLFIAVDVSDPASTEFVREWLDQFIRGFRLGPRNVRTSILRFSDDVDYVISLRYGTHLGRTRNQIRRQLTPVPSATVNTAEALQAIVMDSRLPVPTSVLIITDNPASDNIAAVNAANTLMDNGADITAIGTSAEEIMALASSEPSAFLITGYDDMPPVAEVLQSVCG